jgi:calcineurin-like phosphoesterase family protein
MLQHLSYKITDNHNIWLTSDLHLGHNKPWIIQARGFKTVEDHDNFVINRINEQAKPSDTILFAGDFCLNTTLDKFKEYCRRIYCNDIVFVSGNHNNPWWKFYKELIRTTYGIDGEVYPFRWNNLLFVGESVDVHINGNQIVHVSHFPKSIWDKQQHNVVMATGHSHGSFKQTLPDYPTHKILDVGWDVFSQLVSYQDFMRIMNKKVLLKLDHHGQETT